MSTSSPMMYRTTIVKTLLVMATMSLLLFSCSKEYKNERPPAYYITQSEQLEIPANVSLPVNHTGGYQRVATYYASGVQKYKAQIKAGSFPESYEWVFVAPRADLFDITNRFVGTHGAGPFWELTGGADSIFAQHFAPPKTSPSPIPGSIDWLLLMPKVGKTPTGIFTDVDYIQRIATEGGKAPVTPPVSLSETAEVPYTAVYRFSKANP